MPCFFLGDKAFASDVNHMNPFLHKTAIGNEKEFAYHGLGELWKMPLVCFVFSLEYF